MRLSQNGEKDEAHFLYTTTEPATKPLPDHKETPFTDEANHDNDHSLARLQGGEEGIGRRPEGPGRRKNEEQRR